MHISHLKVTWNRFTHCPVRILATSLDLDFATCPQIVAKIAGFMFLLLRINRRRVRKRPNVASDLECKTSLPVHVFLDRCQLKKPWRAKSVKRRRKKTKVHSFDFAIKETSLWCLRLVSFVEERSRFASRLQLFFLFRNRKKARQITAEVFEFPRVRSKFQTNPAPSPPISLLLRYTHTIDKVACK